MANRFFHLELDRNQKMKEGEVRHDETESGRIRPIAVDDSGGNV